MRNRNKYDWSKPFKFIDNKKVFDQLDTNEQSLIINVGEDNPKSVNNIAKQQIPVPKIETVPRVTEVKKFAKINSNYIRLSPSLNLPLANSYELTQVDHVFLKSNENKYIFKGKKVLTEQFLRKVIMDLEIKAGKDMVLPRSKGWFISILQKDFKELLQMDNLQQFAETIYNYWKNRRQQLKFPLLRVLWRPTPDEYNHMLAFRPRQRDKRNLRRANRVVDDQLIEELYEQFDLTVKLAERIQLRQQLKLKQTQLQMANFYSQCKNFISTPQAIIEFKSQERVKDKQRMRGFHQQIQKLKNRKQSLQNIKVDDVSVVNVDQKQSIVNFLASVVYEAQQLGISYQKMFYNSNSFVEKPKNMSSIYSTMDIVEEPPIQSKIMSSDQPFVQVSLHKFEDKIYRSFSEDQSDTHHIKPCKDFLEFKRRKVDKYYFGSDDQGEIKDLRRIISTSFKKFMQMQVSKPAASTGQN